MPIGYPRSSHTLLAALALLWAAPATAEAAEEMAEKHDYIGSQACESCHEGLEEPYSHTIHARVLTEANAQNALMMQGCEACHGPASEHVAEGGGRGVGDLVSFRAESPEAIERENGVCLTCHAKGAQLHWSGSPHESRDVACTSCHVVMEKRSSRHQLKDESQMKLCGSCHLIQRAQMFRNAHMPVREGAMECTSCHNPHGTVTESMLRYDTVNDTCYSCHADKRGPFLWEHPPVSENCLNCHEPHGSTRRVLLKGDPPRLCQQCHVATRHPSDPRDAEDPRFVTSRSCVQCHANIHGSNHPSGFRFMR